MNMSKRLDLPWEHNVNGSDAVMILPAMTHRHPAYLLKLLAISKMADVTIISSEFRGEQLVYTTTAWLLRDFGARVDFSGVYTLAFPHEEKTDDLPDICVRTAEYDRDEDYRLFQEASDKVRYLHHGQPCRAFSQFVSSDSHPTINELIEDLDKIITHGLEIGRHAENNDGIHALRLYGYPKGVECEVMYPATTHRSERVHRWAIDWHECCWGVRESKVFRPDGGSRLSYRQSFFDRLAALAGEETKGTQLFD